MSQSGAHACTLLDTGGAAAAAAAAALAWQFPRTACAVGVCWCRFVVRSSRQELEGISQQTNRLGTPTEWRRWVQALVCLKKLLKLVLNVCCSTANQAQQLPLAAEKEFIYVTRARNTRIMSGIMQTRMIVLLPGWLLAAL
jgi:hypothetical protein